MSELPEIPEQLPASERPEDQWLCAGVLDYRELRERIRPRMQAKLEEIKRLFAERFPDARNPADVT